MIRGTGHLGHLEAAGIVVDLLKDWSQFYKEFASSSMARTGQAPRSQSLRLGHRPSGPVRPYARRTEAGRAPAVVRARPNRDTGRPEWDEGDRHVPSTTTGGATARGGAAGC